MGVDQQGLHRKVIVSLIWLIVLVIFLIGKFCQGLYIGWTEARGAPPYLFGNYWYAKHPEEPETDGERD